MEGEREGEHEVKDEKRRKEEGGKLAVTFVARKDAAAEGMMMTCVCVCVCVCVCGVCVCVVCV